MGESAADQEHAADTILAARTGPAGSRLTYAVVVAVAEVAAMRRCSSMKPRWGLQITPPDPYRPPERRRIDQLVDLAAVTDRDRPTMSWRPHRSRRSHAPRRGRRAATGADAPRRVRHVEVLEKEEVEDLSILRDLDPFTRSSSHPACRRYPPADMKIRQSACMKSRKHPARRFEPNPDYARSMLEGVQ